MFVCLGSSNLISIKKYIIWLYAPITLLITHACRQWPPTQHGRKYIPVSEVVNWKNEQTDIVHNNDLKKCLEPE